MLIAIIKQIYCTYEKSLCLKYFIPKGDLWVQSPMIIVGQWPNIRSIAENRRRLTTGELACFQCVDLNLLS